MHYLTSAKYILPLSAQAPLSRAGGKGANLAQLACAGFIVPPGFIVTTDAYDMFTTASQVRSHILALAHAISSDDLAALDRTSAAIRGLFEQENMPDEIATSIAAAYRELGFSAHAAGLAVAIRSSATTEDLPGLAYAGQQDTYLNIIGEQAVLDAVKNCWGSLWTARALAYRLRNHISPDEIAMAVVVQQMVVSESSGVLFTANPLTGRRDEMVIDASFGLGEAIVSGYVDPDHYVVNSQTGRITARKLGAKARAIVPRADGGIEHVSRNGPQQPALSDAQVVELAQTAQRVAEHFGSPQDIEWAWANQQLHLLQARPITSLYPLPANTQVDEALRVYVNFNSIQGVVDPLTPMGIDAIRMLFSHVPDLVHAQSSIRQLLPEAGSRLFLDLTDLVRDPRLRNLVPQLLAETDPGARQILVRILAEKPIAPKRVLTLRRVFTLLLGLSPILRRVLLAMLAPDGVYPRVIALAEQFIAEAQADAHAAPDLKTRLRAMEKDLSRAEETFFPVMPIVLPVLSAVPRLDRWLSDWLGEKPGAAFQLVRGLKNLTTEMDLKLWAAAQMIRGDDLARETWRVESVENLVEAYHQGKLPTTAQRALEEFLQVYGMRAVAEIDLGRPRWREDPTPIVQTLQGYLQMNDANLAPDANLRRNQERAEYLAADWIARARRTRWGWLRARLIGGIVRRLRALSGLREVPLFYMVKTLDIYRAVLLDSGRELVAQQHLERAEDVFFVPFDTLTQFAQGDDSTRSRLDLKGIAAANRATYEREFQRKQMPRVLLSNGEAFYEGMSDEAASANDLIGEAVSPGVVEGRAHVIRDPRRARLEPGEILICPSTDPGWTPLFLTAGGLVMEIGGMITHGSVVARECGIPAVVGVHQATTRLKTGDRVRVDGNSGRVTVLDERD